MQPGQQHPGVFPFRKQYSCYLKKKKKKIYCHEEGIQTQEANVKLLQLNEVVEASLISRADCCLELQPNLVSVPLSDKSDHSPSSRRNGL